MRSKTNNGIGLVEVIVGTAIISVSLVSIVTAFNLYVRAGLTTTEKIQATYLAEEGLEVIRSLRDSGWTDGPFSALDAGTPYYLVFSSGAWEATTTPMTNLGTFTRTVSIEEVYRRNTDDDIVEQSSPDAKTLDPNTKKVTATVVWENAPGSSPVSYSLATYVTNRDL